MTVCKSGFIRGQSTVMTDLMLEALSYQVFANCMAMVEKHYIPQNSGLSRVKTHLKMFNDKTLVCFNLGQSTAPQHSMLN